MSVQHPDLPRALSLASHELRTPLSVVAGYIKMLLREQAGPLADKQRKMLEEADKSCSRVTALLTEMSEVGKFASGEITVRKQPLDFGELIREVAGRMHEGRDRGVILKLRGADRPLRILGDRARLEAALGALLHASLRERGEGGVLIVDCSVTEGPNASAVVAIGDEAAVRDLAASARAPFDVWSRGGVGLALPLARQIVEAHGGALWARDEADPRAGSGLRIPLSEDSVQLGKR